MRSTFTFNGHCCDEFGIYISKKPNINRSQRKFQSASVAGRNGNIYQLQDAWDEVVVTYDIFAGGYEQGDAPSDFTDIMEWLNSADDYARLKDSYDTEHYRMAVFVDATNIEQKWYSTGQAQIKFRCKPQHFLDIPDVDVNSLRNYYKGEIVSFDGDGQNLENLTAEIKAVQSGSGDPSPENIRPISGWDEVNANVAGKNLVDSSNAVPNLPKNTVGAGIDEVIVSTRYSHSVPVRNDVPLTISARSNNITTFDYVAVYGYRDEKFVGYYGSRNIANTTTVYSFSIPANTYEKIIIVYGASASAQVGTNISGDIQLEIGTTATSYEPYNGQTYTIDLNGTRYGGTLDVTTGVLTITYALVDMGTLNWTKNSSYNLMQVQLQNAEQGVSGIAPSLLCDRYTTDVSGSNADINAHADKTITLRNASNVVIIKDSAYTDAASFKTAMSGAQLVYELATPQTVQLTPQQVKTLVGENNIWVDSGEVDVVTAPSIANPTNHVALPIITLTGAGASSLLDLEKDSPDHNESGMPYYFSELLPCFGAVLTGMSGSQRYVSMFTDAYAEIDKLRIVGRQNSTGHVSFTAMNPDYGVGTAIEVNTNTDYTISASTNRPCTVQVLFFTGVVGLITSEAHASNNGGDLRLTFRTPSDCSKILIAFFTVDSTTITVSSIMVNKGTEALPFRAFAADTSETITIKDTTLKILMNGFKTAVIDCERENFSVDGADSNTSVSVLDQYGNLSDEYLKIDKGRNKVAYSDGIVSVMLKPRFWEL